MDLYDSESDYILLYMIYQMDEESLETMLDKYYMYSMKLLNCYLQRYEFELFGDECLKDIQTLILKAIYAYRDDRKASFMTFYHKIFYYQILNYRRRYLTYKGTMERNLLSLDNFVNDNDDGSTYLDFMVNEDTTLEGSYALDQEQCRYVLRQLFNELRPIEREAVIMYQSGYAYRDIAEILKLYPRQVEYILAKVRKSKALID